jgi:two-component system NarL family response regulator
MTAARRPEEGDTEVAGAKRLEPIRVLIADDHALFRRGLEMVLDEEDDIDLVGQASDGTEAVAVAGESLPDVVLMDIRMPKVSGIEAARAMKVHGGQSLINPSMAGKLLTEFATLAKRDTEEEEAQHVAPPKLTDREMEVLKLVARGMNNRDIAKELFISENTVKNHVRNILEKLQIHSRMEAVMIAVRQKLIEFS